MGTLKNWNRNTSGYTIKILTKEQKYSLVIIIIIKYSAII